MKKILALLLALSFVFALVACSNVKDTTSEPDTSMETSKPNMSNKDNAIENLITVPNVIGMSFEDGKKLLESSGFVVEFKKVNKFITLTKYPNLNIHEIFEQSLTAGLVCDKNTKIEIKYMSEEPDFEYVVNENGKINIIGVSAYYSLEKILIIPENYNGKDVEKIIVDSIYLPEGWELRIPSVVEIIGATKIKITRY